MTTITSIATMRTARTSIIITTTIITTIMITTMVTA